MHPNESPTHRKSSKTSFFLFLLLLLSFVFRLLFSSLSYSFSSFSFLPFFLLFPLPFLLLFLLLLLSFLFPLLLLIFLLSSILYTRIQLCLQIKGTQTYLPRLQLFIPYSLPQWLICVLLQLRLGLCLSIITYVVAIWPSDVNRLQYFLTYTIYHMPKNNPFFCQAPFQRVSSVPVKLTWN